MGGFKLFKPGPDIKELRKKKDTLGLINMLEDKNPDTRTNTIQALIDIGLNAVEPLKATVIHNDSIARESAAQALGEIDDHMVVIIRGGLIKYANPAVSRILGYTNYQILNKQFTEFVAPEYEELVLERYKKRLMDEKVPSTYPVQVLSREKNRFKVELHASHIKFEGRSADLAILKLLK